ncbi:hypothetical protein Asulf_01204 [Archaeoglobus sulfaticallidus PM70-1]|uniref:Uncharacterized protein n=1 Tax=Archaeoglobus sulfaticallidus PM70-1 TaxID=387631 RepID=N0BFX5_9EURY|nr:hypothetical protein [Archaeoglobus sulfaticallidus]AGK61202.1 hypothetical protein Asulf_01204 [Archaeoglobus sulfaticallidus PM70-1]
MAKKTQGKEVPDDSDELMMQVASSQLKANYRKSLGKEYARRSWDLEIKKALKKKEEERKAKQ